MTLVPSPICDLAPDEPALAPLSTYLEVSDGRCRWPMGPDSELGCCGRAAVKGPYCPIHRKRGISSHQAQPHERPDFARVLRRHYNGTQQLLAKMATAEELGL